MSYLYLPIRKEDNKLCTRCGEIGHWKRYCRTTTWCKFCTSETHALQACRRYTNFVRDNPIVSSRRTRPVQEQRKSVQPEPLRVNEWQQLHQQGADQKQLLPHPPTQCFQPPVVPPVKNRDVQRAPQ